MRRRKLDRQIDDELAAYVAERAAQLRAAGVAPDEAERRARAELGSVAAVKDEMRDAHVASSWLDGLLKDLRLALRRLVRQPGFAVVAVLLTAPERGQIYIAHAKSPRERLAFLVRGTITAAAARAAVAALDGELAVAKVRPLGFYLERAQRPARFTMVLASNFGGPAMLLAAIGVYGVVATSVSQRRRELGVRLALGAEPRDIVRLVLREGAAMALAGLALGALATLLLARLLGGVLYGVSPLDPATLAAAAVLLPAAALVACWLPARRAAAASPMAALRTE